MRLYKWPALRLAFIPGLIEAFFDGGIASVLFKMPIMLAISMGFILKAVGPGLVVPAMFQLQKAGWGANKGRCRQRGKTTCVELMSLHHWSSRTAVSSCWHMAEAGYSLLFVNCWSGSLQSLHVYVPAHSELVELELFLGCECLEILHLSVWQACGTL